MTERDRYIAIEREKGGVMCLCAMGVYESGELKQRPSRIKALKMIMLSRHTDQCRGSAFAHFPRNGPPGAQLLHQKTASGS